MHRYSRQREAIKGKLAGRCDHPTAELLYAELREEHPNISLATVYRNLKQLEETGEVMAISTDGATRYDPKTAPHSHFFCTDCGAVIDIEEDDSAIIRLAQDGFDGVIKAFSTRYFGLCPQCAKRLR